MFVISLFSASLSFLIILRFVFQWWDMMTQWRVNCAFVAGCIQVHVCENETSTEKKKEVRCLSFKMSITFWRRIFFFFFQILALPVFKMWVIQKPNKVALWNKGHFEEKKKRRLDNTFKIFSTDNVFVE